MTREIHCSACERLKQNSPNFVVNGITDEECKHLHNNKGLNGESDNCTDLNDINDCLIAGLRDKLPAYDDCDWKAFSRDQLENLWNIFKAMICNNCGIWEAIEQANYAGVATLWTTNVVHEPWQDQDMRPAFNQFTEKSNLSDEVLESADGFRSIVINNTTSVPLLCNSTFNCSIDSDQLLSACYIVITRDGRRIGQAPFIAPRTYDQQVHSEAFILDPGEKTTLSYYMRVGVQNILFPPIFGGTGKIACVLDNDEDIPTNQRSFFNVSVTSVVGKKETN